MPNKHKKQTKKKRNKEHAPMKGEIILKLEVRGKYLITYASLSIKSNTFERDQNSREE